MCAVPVFMRAGTLAEVKLGDYHFTIKYSFVMHTITCMIVVLFVDAYGQLVQHQQALYYYWHARQCLVSLIKMPSCKPDAYLLGCYGLWDSNPDTANNLCSANLADAACLRKHDASNHSMHAREKVANFHFNLGKMSFGFR